MVPYIYDQTVITWPRASYHIYTWYTRSSYEYVRMYDS